MCMRHTTTHSAVAPVPAAVPLTALVGEGEGGGQREKVVAVILSEPVGPVKLAR